MTLFANPSSTLSLDSFAAVASFPVSVPKPKSRPKRPRLFCPGGDTVLSIAPGSTVLKPEALLALQTAFVKRRKIGLDSTSAPATYVEPLGNHEAETAEAAYSIAQELVAWACGGKVTSPQDLEDEILDIADHKSSEAKVLMGFALATPTPPMSPLSFAGAFDLKNADAKSDVKDDLPLMALARAVTADGALSPLLSVTESESLFSLDSPTASVFCDLDCNGGEEMRKLECGNAEEHRKPSPYSAGLVSPCSTRSGDRELALPALPTVEDDFFVGGSQDNCLAFEFD